MNKMLFAVQKKKYIEKNKYMQFGQWRCDANFILISTKLTFELKVGVAQHLRTCSFQAMNMPYYKPTQSC
ncbi:hypothetical protein Hanom_Chr04g00384671 [Helianthus anomalus]